MQRIFNNTAFSLVKRPVPRQLITPLTCRVVNVNISVRGCASSSNKAGDHNNFDGPKTDNNGADHSNFNGPKGGIPVPKFDLEEENIEQKLRQDAALKHRQAAQTGDFVAEIQARVEQSMADRLRDHDKPNHPKPQQKLYDVEFHQTTVYALRQEAAATQRLAEHRNNDALREEAELEEAIADMLDEPKITQSLFQRADEQQDQPLIGPNGIFRSAYELKLDAAAKQSIASRTHDQQLMKEAHLEQSIADALSPNAGGQPLYGKRVKARNNTSVQQSASETNAQAPQSVQAPQKAQTPQKEMSVLHQLASNGGVLFAEKQEIAKQHFVEQQQIAHQQLEQQRLHEPQQQNSQQGSSQHQRLEEFEHLAQRRNEEQNAFAEDMQSTQERWVDTSESHESAGHHDHANDRAKWANWL